MSRSGYVGFGAPYAWTCVSRLWVERCGGGRGCAIPCPAVPVV